MTTGLKQITLCSIIGACIAGCSDGDNSSSNESDTDVAFTAPTSGDALADFVTTRYVNPNDFDVWLCTEVGAMARSFAHALPPVNTLGEGRTGIEFTLTDGGQSSFTWEAIGSNGIEFTYTDAFEMVISNNYSFADENSWYLDYIDGPEYDCSRVSYMDALNTI